MSNELMAAASKKRNTVEAEDPDWASVVLLMKMNDVGLTDSTGKRETFLVNQVARSSAQSKFGGFSAVFDGAADRIRIGPTADFYFDAGNFTVEGWVYPVTLSGTVAFVYGYGDLLSVAGSSWGCNLTSASSTSDLYVGGSVYGIASPNPPLNQWSHVAWVRNGGTWTSYLNGVVVGTRSDLGTSSVNKGLTTYPPTIGGNDVGTSTLNGYIDEVRVTKGVARYTGAFTPPTKAFPVGDAPADALINNVVLLTNYSSGNYLDVKGHTVNAFGNAAVTGGRLVLDGTGDYLEFPHHVDYDFNSNDYCIEIIMQVMVPSSTYDYYFSKDYYASQRGWAFYLESGYMAFLHYAGGSYSLLGNRTEASTGMTRRHYAIVKQGTNFRKYVDGVSVHASNIAGSATHNDTDFPILLGAAFINTVPSAFSQIDVYGIRITNGNCRYTGLSTTQLNFNPPLTGFPEA